jgi:hypothetical protein
LPWLPAVKRKKPLHLHLQLSSCLQKLHPPAPLQLLPPAPHPLLLTPPLPLQAPPLMQLPLQAAQLTQLLPLHLPPRSNSFRLPESRLRAAFFVMRPNASFCRV